MTISVTTSTISYQGNGSTTVFTIPWLWFLDTDITIQKITGATGVVSTLILNTDYTLSGVGTGGGTATLSVAPLGGSPADTVTIFLNPPLTQLSHYVANAEFPSATLEQNLDREVQISQRLQAQISKALRAPDADNNPSMTLPVAASRANRYVVFDNSGNVSTSSGSGTDTALRADLIAGLSSLVASTAIKYPQTAAELAASVTPVNLYYQPGYAIRQGANTTPGTTDMQPGIQAAINSASLLDAEVYLKSSNAIAKPLLLKTTTQQNISIIGNGRVSTTLFPLAASISTAPQSVNALIINQNNNTHLHLSKFGCADSVVYTGIFLYCTEGGCSDGTGQALFSAVFDDLWFAFSSNNSGYCRGGFSNLRVSKCVFENTKTACFRLEGLGNADQQYIGNVMNSAYDSFILGTDDTNTKALIQVIGLNSYQHLRGPLIEAKNVVSSEFNTIIEEPDAANVGTTGILKLTDSADIIGNNLMMKSRSGVPRGSCALEFINGATGVYSNIVSDGTTGIRFSGTGALNLTFNNCDFSGCDNAVQWLSGTLSGKVTFNNCKFNNAQGYGLLVSAGTMSWDLTLVDCELMNAGLNAVTTSRNMDMNTSGKVRLIRCKIGQDNGSAAAAYFLKNSGSGTFEVIDPILVGAPPTGFNDGASAIKLDGVNSDMPGMAAFTPSIGGSATYTGQIGYWSLKNKACTFYVDLTINVIGTGNTNQITALPFVSHATMYGGGVGHFWSSSASSITDLVLSVSPGSQTIQLRSLTAAGTGTANNAIFQNGARVILSGSYPIP